MKNLTKELQYKNGDATTKREILELANRLLATEWTIDIYRHASAKTYRLDRKGWTFEFNSRKRAAGLCAPGKKVIYISEYLLMQNLNKALEFENTLRHELAHAIDFEMRGTSDHSRVWKAVAREVLCTAERCFTSEQIADTRQTKYTLICDTCKKKSPSHKIKKRKSACGDCCNEHNNGRFSDKYVLRQVQNW